MQFKNIKVHKVEKYCQIKINFEYLVKTSFWSKSYSNRRMSDALNVYSL